MYYYLTIALQAYCIYHTYKNRKPYYWYFIIFFIPVFGSIIYLITQVYNNRDAKKITSEITHIINPTKKVKDLKQQLQFAETYQNRVNLADAYLEIKDFNNAIIYYLEALEDDFENDLYVIKQIMEAYFHAEDFNNVILNAQKIKNHPEFKKSRAQFIYGLALERVGKLDKAEANLKAIDIRYSFYNERLVFAKFLISQDKITEAKAVLNEVFSESKHMTKPNLKLFRSTILEVEKLRNTL